MFAKFAIAALLAAAPMAASAAEFIVNGDFETGGGSLTGWTATANTAAIHGSSYVLFAGGSGSAAAQANTFASFGAGNTAGTETLAQTIATVAGRSYTLSFDSGSFNGNQAVELFVGGNSVGTYTPSGTSNLDALFTPHSYVFTGSGSPTEILFSVVTFQGDNQDALVDNVSVTAVPEPASWALMIAGFGMVGFAARRRRPAATAA